MSYIDWNDSYATGIKTIDDQHKKIIELINELIESLRDGREDLIIKEVLRDLADYASNHFGLEEEIFRKFHYEVKREHIDSHKDFIEKIKSLRSEEEISKGEIALKTLNYLRDWFRDHELKLDSDFGLYFKSNELSDSIESMLQGGNAQ